MLDSFAQRREHFAGSLAGGADYEDKAKLLFVGAIQCGKRVDCVMGSSGEARLLLAGPLVSLCRNRLSGFFLADLGVTTESFQPIVAIQ